MGRGGAVNDDLTTPCFALMEEEGEVKEAAEGLTAMPVFTPSPHVMIEDRRGSMFAPSVLLAGPRLGPLVVRPIPRSLL